MSARQATSLARWLDESEKHQDARADRQQVRGETDYLAALRVGCESDDDRHHADSHQQQPCPVVGPNNTPQPQDDIEQAAGQQDHTSTIRPKRISAGVAEPTPTWAPSSAAAGPASPEEEPARRQIAGSADGGDHRAEGDLRGSLVPAVGALGLPQNRRLDPGEIDDRQVAVGRDRVAAAVARVVAGREVPRTSTAGLAATESTMWSRSISVSASILCVTCSVKSESPRRGRRCRRQPVDAATAGQQPLLGRAPEPDVVAPGRAARDLLLVGEVLLPAEQEERADRCFVDSCGG